MPVKKLIDYTVPPDLTALPEDLNQEGFEIVDDQMLDLLDRLERKSMSVDDVLVSTAGSEIKVAVVKEPSLITITFTAAPQEDQNYVVYTSEWHGHFLDAGEAVDAIFSILDGTSRIVEEWRGETFAGGWRETWQGTAYEVFNVSLYLNPFDVEEWRSSEGGWNRKITHRRYIASPVPVAPGCPRLGEKKVEDITSNQSQAQVISGSKDWLVHTFGPPPEGTRWTLCACNSLVLPLPLGWLAYPPKGDSRNRSDFWKEGETALIRIIGFFRRREVPAGKTAGQEGVPPVSVNYSSQDPCSHSLDHRCHLWECNFENGKEDMLARIYFYQMRSDARNLSSVVAELSACVKLSRFVTEDDEE